MPQRTFASEQGIAHGPARKRMVRLEFRRTEDEDVGGDSGSLRDDDAPGWLVSEAGGAGTCPIV